MARKARSAAALKPRATSKTNSDPSVVLRGALAAGMAGVGHATRLDQQKFDLLFGARLVLNAFRHDEHLADGDANRAITKIDPQDTVEHNEGLVSVLVIVPNEIALQLHDLELIVVHFGNDFRLPLLVEQTEFLAKINGLVRHAVPHCQRTLLLPQ